MLGQAWPGATIKNGCPGPREPRGSSGCTGTGPRENANGLGTDFEDADEPAAGRLGPGVGHERTPTPGSGRAQAVAWVSVTPVGA